MSRSRISRPSSTGAPSSNNMILERAKFGFRTARVTLEDDRLPAMRDSGAYSSIIAVSYKKMDLPGFARTEKTTALVDLTRSEDDIFKSFNDTTRNEIRKTLKDDDISVAVAIPIAEESYNLYSSFELTQGRLPVHRADLGGCIFFGTYREKELLSGIFVIQSRPYLRIRSIFSKRLHVEDKEMYKHISNATRRAIWEICRWGKQNSFQSLDMASVNLSNPKTVSIAKFKMSFGGNIITEYTYTYKTKAFALFESAARLRVRMRRLSYAISRMFGV